jgi:hypothetical protein
MHSIGQPDSGRLLLGTISSLMVLLYECKYVMSFTSYDDSGSIGSRVLCRVLGVGWQGVTPVTMIRMYQTETGWAEWVDYTDP